MSKYRSEVDGSGVLRVFLREALVWIGLEPQMEAGGDARCPRFNSHDCLCPPERPAVICPAALRDRRDRERLAGAWDEGMEASVEGFGSDHNPYREWSR